MLGEEEVGPGGAPCEEAEAIHAGRPGPGITPCEEAEAIVADVPEVGGGPCEEAEAVHAGWRGRVGSAGMAAASEAAGVG